MREWIKNEGGGAIGAIFMKGLHENWMQSSNLQYPDVVGMPEQALD